MNGFFKKIMCLAVGALLVSALCPWPVYADASIALSPMNRVMIIDPGQEADGTFLISNAASNDEDVNYEITVIPYFPNENNEKAFEYVGDYNLIVDWIKIDHSEGTISPNQTREVHYTIDVPENAPAGGQYAAIKVSSKNEDPDNMEGLSTSISVSFGIAYIIYAEIAGTTEHGGEITDVAVPGFIFDGDISGHASIENTGNVHSKASYKLQIFPLFSNEEVYTNEENPDAQYVMPDRIFYHETIWDETPAVGIFNVIYTVEFEGVTTQVSKIVIKCPIWLLLIIFFVIFALIFYFVAKAKARKKAARKPQDA